MIKAIKNKKKKQKKINTNTEQVIGYVMYVIIITTLFVKYVIDVKHRQNNLTYSSNF